MRTFSPVSPPPERRGRQLHSRFWKGKEVSDCTPPTGVRWAAQDGCSEVGVKSPAFSPRTPAGSVFKKEGQRFSPNAVAAMNGLEMGPTKKTGGCGGVLAV